MERGEGRMWLRQRARRAPFSDTIFPRLESQYVLQMRSLLLLIHSKEYFLAANFVPKLAEKLASKFYGLMQLFLIRNLQR